MFAKKKRLPMKTRKGQLMRMPRIIISLAFLKLRIHDQGTRDLRSQSTCLRRFAAKACQPTPMVAMVADAPTPDNHSPPAAAGPSPLRSVHTTNFPAILDQLGSSLLVTTYQA